jgi:uncharacterized protein (TIGR03083 family)
MTTNAAAPALTLPLEPGIARPAAMRLAATEYQRYVDQLRGLDPADWSKPTDCTGWDVRAMVAHSLGMAEMSASVLETGRQMRAARRRHHTGDFIDALTAVQVDKHRDRTPAELIERFAAVAPRAVRGRKRVPPFMRRRPMPGEQPTGDGRTEQWKLGFLIDVCYTRDVWMHRTDIAGATGRDLVLTADHDGVLVADVAREWAERHGQPCSLTLTGPAGGTWTWGKGGETLELDAVVFARTVSGRGAAHGIAGEGLLATSVPF